MLLTKFKDWKKLMTPSTLFIMNSVWEQLLRFHNHQKLKRKFKLKSPTQLNLKEDHSKLFLIGQKLQTALWTLTFTCLMIKSLHKEDNLTQLFISYQDWDVHMTMHLKNQDLPDMLINIESLLYSLIQVQEIQELMEFHKIGKLETAPVIMLMLPMKRQNNLSKCILILTRNFQNLFQLISLSVEPTFQSLVSAWEVMEL